MNNIFEIKSLKLRIYRCISKSINANLSKGEKSRFSRNLFNRFESREHFSMHEHSKDRKDRKQRGRFAPFLRVLLGQKKFARPNCWLVRRNSGLLVQRSRFSARTRNPESWLDGYGATGVPDGLLCRFQFLPSSFPPPSVHSILAN